MSIRAPFQVLIIPFWTDAIGVRRYCIFRRRDAGYWQGIAGGGEVGETPEAAALREAREEAGFSRCGSIFQLDTTTSIPVVHVNGFLWGDEVPIIPEYSFGCEVINSEVTLSNEHTEYQWVKYEEAVDLLKWDSNKTALWELEFRISKGMLNNNSISNTAL
jgi:dihydroneopterin triphosphate diphosphatase